MLIGHASPMLVGCIAAVAALINSRVLRVPVPLSQWQLPKAWGRLGPNRLSFVFGVLLGLGFVTLMPTAGFYALAAALQSYPPQGALVLGVAFGITRGAPSLTLAALGRLNADGASYLDLADGISNLVGWAELLLLLGLATTGFFILVNKTA